MTKLLVACCSFAKAPTTALFRAPSCLNVLRFGAYGSRGGAVGWGTALQTGRLRVRLLMVSLEFFIDIILPDSLWPWGSTQPLTEMSTRKLSWGGKGGRCVVLISLPPSCADCLEIWEPQTPGTLRACPSLYRDCYTFTVHCLRHSSCEFSERCWMQINLM